MILSFCGLKHFEDWLTTIEVRPGVYDKSVKQKNLYHHISIHHV